MVNTNKLKGRMKELEITQADVAKVLGIAQPTANQKLNNIRSFDLEEAEKLSAMLHIEAGEFGTYFFAH
ncbi:MAG: helix-turn-helix domain-containing protein [Oscillospiraceae bacterium]|nr:helix-turn-helix domain-containing protein [Oscillospiraceae bacterium]